MLTPTQIGGIELLRDMVRDSATDAADPRAVEMVADAFDLLLEEITRLTTALDAQAAVVLDMEREAVRLTEERGVLRGQVQVLSDSLRREEMRRENHAARLSGETG